MERGGATDNVVVGQPSHIDYHDRGLAGRILTLVSVATVKWPGTRSTNRSSTRPMTRKRLVGLSS